MSTPRTRPTRDDTRERIFEAAAQVFEERGVNGASIEAIVAAAGFTRGAFYSNFASKDELVIAMLEDHVEQSLRRNLDLLAQHPDPVRFVEALSAVDRTGQDPLGRSPMLHIELILYVARSETHRPELAKRLRGRRHLIAEILRATDSSHDTVPLDPDGVAAMLLALEDGFRLHRLIDPDSTPPDSFMNAVRDLQKAIGMGPETT